MDSKWPRGSSMAWLWALRLEGAPVLRAVAKTPSPTLGWLLPAGHHREWLWPHFGRAATKDCAVPTGRGQRPQDPRRPKANHSPLRTGMYPGLWLIWVWFALLFSRSCGTYSRCFFVSALFAKTIPWSLHIFQCLFGANMFWRGIFKNFEETACSGHKLAELWNEVIKCSCRLPPQALLLRCLCQLSISLEHFSIPGPSLHLQMKGNKRSLKKNQLGVLY